MALVNVMEEDRGEAQDSKAFFVLKNFFAREVIAGIFFLTLVIVAVVVFSERPADYCDTCPQSAPPARSPKTHHPTRHSLDSLHEKSKVTHNSQAQYQQGVRDTEKEMMGQIEQVRQQVEQEISLVQSLQALKKTLATQNKNGNKQGAASTRARMVTLENKQKGMEAHRLEIAKEMRHAELTFLMDTYGDMLDKYKSMQAMADKQEEVLQATMRLAQIKGNAMQEFATGAMEAFIGRTREADEVMQKNLKTRMEALSHMMNED
eukprot:JP435909.1.p1 GENE.JP435909.1~~JP435909.1.p1  ORF type:complete len:263 (+),score=58.15 JP435909.1:20-808(+)